MLSISAVLHALILLVCVGLCFGLCWWLLGKVKLPEPFRSVAEAVLAIAAVLILISILLGLAGIEVWRP